jgi:hypothetical protein
MTVELVPPSTDEYDTALARVRAYAEKIRAGEKAADQESLDRAADLAILYEDKRWVEDEAIAGRAPKTKVFRGRPVDPESRNRFASWVLTHEGLSPSYTRRLLAVHTWRSNYCASGTLIPPTEGAIRPLYALERRGYGDDTPKVLARAKEIAGDMPVTSAHIKESLSEFWAAVPKVEQKYKLTVRKAEQLRKKTIADFDLLIEMGAYGDAQEALRVAAQHLRDAHRRRASA